MEELPMKKIQIACLLAAFAAVVSLSPAQAQVYASPAGTATSCTASAPCKLDTAISVAAAAGNGAEVACIGGAAGDLPPITTGGSFEVDCPGGLLAVSSALTLTGTNTQIVKLRNLTFSNFGSNVPTPFIRVTGGATLILENCRFEDQGARGTTGGTPIAIQFTPSSPAAQLIIRDTVFANNGIAPGSGGGLQVAPAAGGSASVVLERVSFNYNVTSMVLSGAVNATMINSTVSASRGNGILVGSGVTLEVKDSTLVYNVGAAVSVASGGTLQLSNNDIKNNQTGISNSGGHAFTYSNNRISGNGSTAALTPVQGGQ
jgi:hypothetical protein